MCDSCNFLLRAFLQQWMQWYPGPGSGQEAECDLHAGASSGPGGGHCGHCGHCIHCGHCGHCGHCRHCGQHSLHPRQVRSSLNNPGIMRTSWQAWYLPADPWITHLQLSLLYVYSDNDSGIYGGLSCHGTYLGLKMGDFSAIELSKPWVMMYLLTLRIWFQSLLGSF